MRRKQSSTWLVVLPLSFFTFLTICTLSALSTVSIGQVRAWAPTDSPDALAEARDAATEGNVTRVTGSASHAVHASIKPRRFGRGSHAPFGDAFGERLLVDAERGAQHAFGLPAPNRQVAV